MQVLPQLTSAASSDNYAGVTNFKKFRKVKLHHEDTMHVPYADRGYAENSIDSTAFLR